MTKTIEQLTARVRELEERRCEICGYAEHHREHTGCLRTQLAAAQEENAHWQKATAENENKWIDACDQLVAAQAECEFQRNAHKQAEELMLEQSKQLAAAQKEIRSRDDFISMLQETQKDQLAKAEQRVAEACALQVATETKFHWLDAARVAKEIRSGEWRKFVKEV